MSHTYRQLNKALVKAGVPAKTRWTVKGCRFEATEAVDILVNTRIDAAPFARILLEYAPKLRDSGEIEMVARCTMQRKGFRDAIPLLLSLFDGYPKNEITHGALWVAGHAIYTINCPESYPKVISICRDRRFASARQNLMGTLARARTDEAYNVLIQCLDDPSVRAHAIEALGRFGRPDAIPILEALPVKKGLYEYKAKATALRRLHRKLTGKP